MKLKLLYKTHQLRFKGVLWLPQSFKPKRRQKAYKYNKKYDRLVIIRIFTTVVKQSVMAELPRYMYINIPYHCFSLFLF